jgi:hypothetical protein
MRLTLSPAPVRSSRHGASSCGRRVEHPRRPVGGHGPADPEAPEHPPLRGRQAPHPGPRVHGGRPLRPPHRLPVEGVERHPLLPRLHRPRPLPALGAGGRLPRVVGGRPAGLRRLEGHRLVLALDGRVHDQGPAGGGKRPGKTPPTAPSAAPSAACWSKAPASRSGWPWTAPTAPT